MGTTQRPAVRTERLSQQRAPKRRRLILASIALAVVAATGAGGELIERAAAQGTPLELSACLLQTENPAIYTVRSTVKNYTGSGGTHYLTDGAEEISLEIPKGFENRLYLDVDTRSQDLVSHGFTGSTGIAEHFAANTMTARLKLCLD